MKSILRFWAIGLLLLVASLLPQFSAAQNCTPDTIFQDAPLGLYPTPFDSLVFPNGGLSDFPATIGTSYELVFTVKMTDSVRLSPFNFDLNSFQLDNTDGILGLPIGLEYACNPPNCVFSDSTLGCIIVSGTPIEANPIGDFNLQFKGQLFANGDDSLNFNFPSTAVPGAYVLSLSRADSLDSDEDGIFDEVDNCINEANSEQIDEDEDGFGAACDCDDNPATGVACALGCQPFYADSDEDGFGNPADSVVACVAPEGYVGNNLDCDDENPTINPLAIEIPDNGIDENCNGLIGESMEAILWFLDEDGDGFGTSAVDSMSIAQPRGFVNNDEDCDDTNQLIYLGALELVDNFDNNCDNLVDNFEGSCDDFTNPGAIGANQIICPDNPVPSTIENIMAPSGGSGVMEIMWMSTTNDPNSGNAQWTLIPNSHALTYTPMRLEQTTYFRRCVRRDGCSKFFQESDIVTISYSPTCEEVIELIETEMDTLSEVMDTITEVMDTVTEVMDSIIEETDPCLTTEILVEAFSNNPDCTIDNGRIELMVSGGTAPYSYAWEPNIGDTTIIDSLSVGNYSVTILDSLNCFSNFSVTLTEPDTCNTPPGLAPEDFEFGRVIATVLDEKVVWLEWEGINEHVSSQYILEHSKSGNDFKVLPMSQKAQGRGKSSYQTSDTAPTLGTSYYRIKYIDPQGKFVYSPIVQVMVTPEGTPLFIAYPNPFEKSLTIDFLSPTTEAIAIKIIDNLGQVVYSTNIPKGALRENLILPETTKGLFTLEVTSKRERRMKKLLKY